jgi:hypothetical protein
MILHLPVPEAGGQSLSVLVRCVDLAIKAYVFFNPVLSACPCPVKKLYKESKSGFPVYYFVKINTVIEITNFLNARAKIPSNVFDNTDVFINLYNYLVLTFRRIDYESQEHYFFLYFYAWV